MKLEVDNIDRETIHSCKNGLVDKLVLDKESTMVDMDDR